MDALQLHLIYEFEYCNRKENTYTVLAVVIYLIELIINLAVLSDWENIAAPSRFHPFILITIIVNVILGTFFVTFFIVNEHERRRINHNLAELYKTSASADDFRIFSRGISRLKTGLTIFFVLFIMISVTLVPIIQIHLFQPIWNGSG